MHVIGTAGHVDHGKSTLVQALTGIDPDRLAEEKRRGLTIDLGFAWMALPSGREVGIVDVPGHERFIKNMLAGVGAINATLFVVAANEGWKPQSQEHLDILDMLDVSAAVVVITKSDMASSDELEAVTAAVRNKVKGTTLAGATVVAVSATTGAGIEELKTEIDRLLAVTPPAPDNRRPRLWIDRIFTIKGSGTVVTGTLTGGALDKGQEVQVLPAGVKARIRSIQSHKKELEHLEPGNRTAVNLAGVELRQLRRGDVLTAPNLWRTTDRVIASIKFLEHLGHDPVEKGAFKLYAGSVELDAEVRFLEAPSKNTESIALVRLDRPAVLDFKDRFIFRDSGRRETLGGGTILEPHPMRARGNTRALLEGGQRRSAAKTRRDYLAILLEERGYLSLADIPVLTGLRRDDAKPMQTDTGIPSMVLLKSFVASAEYFAQTSDRLMEAIHAYQRDHPLSSGMPMAELRALLSMDLPFVEDLVAELVSRGVAALTEGEIRTPEFKPQIESPESARLIETVSSAGASPPPAADLNRQFGQDLVRALVKSGDLVSISPDLVYPTEWIRQLQKLVAERVETEGPFTVAEFRDLVKTSRRYAVPLLEHLDQTGITRRQGDLRTLGPKAKG